jgi:cell fate (sporulation/competence/biofilm development) regulator YmcA (YheA/YmcA/DUF963 family)
MDNKPTVPLTPEEQTKQDELKKLLETIVRDIKEDKLTKELTEKLIATVNSAKNDFLNALKQVETTIEKFNNKDKV